MPKKTLEKIAPDKRERLLREAALLFAERGFARADMAQLAARAGVAKGSIYNYFDSKDDLYLHVCRDGLRRSQEAIYGDDGGGRDIYRHLEHMFRAGVAFVHEHPEYVVLYSNVASPGMARFANELTVEVESRTASHLKELIRAGVEAGTVRADVDVEMAAFVVNSLYITLVSSIVSPHHRLRMMRYLDLDAEPDGETFAAQVDRIVAMAQSLFRPQPSRGTTKTRKPRSRGRSAS